MKLHKSNGCGCRKNEMGLSSSPKTEFLTERLIKALKKCNYVLIEREKKVSLGGYRYAFKDVYMEDEDGKTWGFEIKTHVADITHSSYGKECHSCNYNYFVVSPDCYYDIVKFLEEKEYDHVGIIVGNRYWLDMMKEAERIE